jgi:hypothetical protein
MSAENEASTENVLEAKLTCIASGLAEMMASLITCMVEAEMAAQQLKLQRLRNILQTGNDCCKPTTATTQTTE